jgi:ectoine hydroxylase-related dioxygenase (phytanoyl-CoA dioxygenase family)
MSDVSANFNSQGFAVVPKLIDSASLGAFSQHLDLAPTSAGSRRLLRQVWCQDLAAGIRTALSKRQLLSPDAVAVQCTLFDKGPSKNWFVSLHQDRSIPVRSKVDSHVLTGWAEKEGDIFVQPPVSVLERLTAVRLHIDDCPAESGALRVVPGSHLRGILSKSQSDAYRATQGEVVVPLSEADALVMKPLMLHGSSKATSGARRRVLHFVYGPRDLPFGLEWQHAT